MRPVKIHISNMFTCLTYKADSGKTQSCSHDCRQCFNYGCCFKEVTHSKMWMLHRFRRSTQSARFEGGKPRLVSSIQCLTICSPAPQLSCSIMTRKCFCRILCSSAKLIFALLGIKCHHFKFLKISDGIKDEETRNFGLLYLVYEFLSYGQKSIL